MMLQDDKVLLVRQTYVPGWFMPGGGIKRNETPEQAARREAREEAGAELGAVKLLGVYSHFGEWKSDHNIVFFCDDFTLTKKHDAEIAELKFFGLNELPENTWPGHRERLEAFRDEKEVPLFGEW